MAIGQITNREKFLNNIANQMGRARIRSTITKPEWKLQPQLAVFSGYSQDELLDILKKQCLNIHTTLLETSFENLVSTLKSVVQQFGGGPVITWNDSRFQEFGLMDLLENEWPANEVDVHVWDKNLGKENVQIAERANVGITFSDITLAESGTVVLFSNSNNGRSVSLLPQTYIAIVPKSTLVPRITQAAQVIQEWVKNGENIPSCINFITGPSNSADIEMNLVVGVHGPVRAAYIVVNDR